MKQSIGLVSLVVPDYDEAIAFYVGVLGFTLIEDSFVPEQNKRWVVVAPPGSTEASLLLARASNPEQTSRIGNQTPEHGYCSVALRLGLAHKMLTLATTVANSAAGPQWRSKSFFRRFSTADALAQSLPILRNWC